MTAVQRIQYTRNQLKDFEEFYSRNKERFRFPSHKDEDRRSGRGGAGGGGGGRFERPADHEVRRGRRGDRDTETFEEGYRYELDQAAKLQRELASAAASSKATPPPQAAPSAATRPTFEDRLPKQPLNDIDEAFQDFDDDDVAAIQPMQSSAVASRFAFVKVAAAAAPPSPLKQPSAAARVDEEDDRKMRITTGAVHHAAPPPPQQPQQQPLQQQQPQNGQNAWNTRQTSSAPVAAAATQQQPPAKQFVPAPASLTQPLNNGRGGGVALPAPRTAQQALAGRGRGGQQTFVDPAIVQAQPLTGYGQRGAETQPATAAPPALAALFSKGGRGGGGGPASMVTGTVDATQLEASILQNAARQNPPQPARQAQQQHQQQGSGGWAVTSGPQSPLSSEGAQFRGGGGGGRGRGGGRGAEAAQGSRGGGSRRGS